MTNIEKRYFDWMCGIVSDSRFHTPDHYRNLLRHLFDIDFTYTISLDGNRATDGEDLRYQFGNEFHIDARQIASEIDYRPCSVLEMMVALSIRCEQSITNDPEIGDRTGEWFWGMIGNLGLAEMDDTNYNPCLVSDIINRMLCRKYDRHGKGGLFTVSHPLNDMRSVDIWYQMMWYVNEVYQKNEKE